MRSYWCRFVLITGFATACVDPANRELPSAARDLAADGPYGQIAGSLTGVDGDEGAVLVGGNPFPVEIVDPHRDMIDDLGHIYQGPDPRLIGCGDPVTATATDGVTQLVLRSRVPGPGRAVFSVISGSPADGSVSPNDGSLAWAASATVDAVAIHGRYYVFALYRSPADFNRGGDEAAAQRAAALKVRYTPARGPGYTRTLAIGLVRPPVIVAPEVWWSCASWTDTGFLGAAPPPERQHPFTATCADYLATSSKGLQNADNRRAIPDAIHAALDLLRGRGVAATRADVIGHGMGGLLARLYIDEVDYLRPDNFRAGTINRLITMNTPHLGARMADEIVRFREFLKQTRPQQWLTVKTTLQQVAIPKFMDPDDGDVIIDELMTTSSIINELGKNAVPPGTVHYHAIIGSGGRNLSRATALNSSMNALYISMELLHPKTISLPPRERINLIHGTESFIFCNNTQATEADDHDKFATTWEQRGGLDDPFVSQFVIASEFPTYDHFAVQFDPAYVQRLIALLHAPVDGGLFAPAMPPPETVSRINHCPMTLP